MSASNYDDACGQLRDYGLLFEQPLRIGTPRSVRCRVEGGGKEKRGWYWLQEILIDNTPVIVGSFGCFRGNDSNTQKVKLGKITRMSSEQAAALKRQIAEASRAAERQREAEIERASRRATTAWDSLHIEGQSPYLASKQVQGHGLRYTKNGTAVVPLFTANGTINGLQFLRTAAQAEESHRPKKEFWPAGLGKKGCYHLIGAVPSGDQVVLVCEGYATGASLHEATGLPVVVAFDAGNIGEVCKALRKVWRMVRFLICADRDDLGTCRDQTCKARITLTDHPTDCPACGKPHRWTNAGESAARTAVLGLGAGRASWLAPVFADDDARRAKFLATGRKLTDYNDLACTEAQLVVGQQVTAHLRAIEWDQAPSAASPSPTSGGRGKATKLQVIQSPSHLLSRFAYVYGSKGAIFDRQEHMLVSEVDVKNLCIRADVYKAWTEAADRDLVRVCDVGFDPTGKDSSVLCNLWAGWPTQPKPGKCDLLLEHLYYLCSAERNAREVYEWILNWVAYPLQHPGAKMRTTVVVHGGQGTGKNVFFEAVAAIYGEYAMVLDQNALADKHNDWASRKLFLIADEVVASSDRYDLKNQLKGLITGQVLRINPKHVGAHVERNHLNLVFLSNERMPVVLEEDDRRHCVVHTPRAKDEAYYIALASEIESGGIEALYHELLQRDLAGFDEHSKPPATESKRELIALARDTPVEFIDAVVNGDLHPLSHKMPGPTEDWFKAYQYWCGTVGAKPTSMKHFVSIIRERRGLRSERKGWRVAGGQAICNPKSVILFGWRPEEGSAEADQLAEQVEVMRNALNDYRNGGVRPWGGA